MTSSYQYSFEKHTYPIEEFECEQAQLGIRGAIGFTRDPARQNFFHRIINFVQSGFKDAVDPKVFHGFILMENDKREEKKDHLVVGEVGLCRDPNCVEALFQGI